MHPCMSADDVSVSYQDGGHLHPGRVLRCDLQDPTIGVGGGELRYTKECSVCFPHKESFPPERRIDPVDCGAKKTPACPLHVR